MYTYGFRINANLVKEGNFRINAKLVKEELMLSSNVITFFINPLAAKLSYLNFHPFLFLSHNFKWVKIT